MAHTIDVRFDREYAPNTGDPGIGDDFLDQCFPVWGNRLRKQIYGAAQGKQQDGARSGDQRDSKGSTQDDQETGRVKKITSAYAGNGDPGDDCNQCDRNPQ